MLNMRLANPSDLIDINRLPDMDAIDVTERAVRVSALVRQRALERSRAVSHRSGVLRDALRYIAHPVIRNRGTVCGSISHADPAAELPSVLRLLNGSVEVASWNRQAVSQRTVLAEHLFLGPLETSLRADELVTQVVLPLDDAGQGSAFEELSRRHGDYAICGVGARVDLQDAVVHQAAVVLMGVDSTPVKVDVTPDLQGTDVTEQGLSEAAERSATACDPPSDIHATADYRLHLVRVLVRRALMSAAERAKQPRGVVPNGETNGRD